MTKQKNLNKRILLSLLICASMLEINSAKAQCEAPSAFTTLDVNNVSVGVGNGQRLWFDGNNPHHEIPAGSGKHTFFSGGTWISGFNPAGQLKLSAFEFGTNGESYSPGPLTVSGGVLYDEVCEEYNVIYELSRAESLTHVQYFDALVAGTVDEEFPDGYDIPQSILDYPGNGDTSIGLSQQLAPFFDRDQDGIYTPALGDCPLFVGMTDEAVCDNCDALNGDVALFWIDNDYGTGDDVDGTDLGVEIQNTVYAFNSWDDLNNTVFYQKKFINRSSALHNDFRIGIFADTEIGCAGDDFVGTDINRNMAYAYNGDNIDSGCDGAMSYFVNPPIAGLKIIKGPLGDSGQELGISAMVSYTNSGQETGGPNFAVEFQNILEGHWTNGAPVTCGGNGYGGIVQAQFMYPGSSNNLPNPECQNWTEYEVFNQPGDRRALLSVGPMTLSSGDSKCITFATIFHPGAGGWVEDIEAIQVVADNVQATFDNCFTGVLSGVENEETIDFALINFDASSSNLRVDVKEQFQVNIRVLDNVGRTILSQKMSGSESFNLSSLAPAAYIVLLDNDKGMSQVTRILKF